MGGYSQIVVPFTGACKRLVTFCSQNECCVFFIIVNIGKGTHCLWFMVSGVSLKIAFRDDLLILKGLLSNLSKDFKQ